MKKKILALSHAARTQLSMEIIEETVVRGNLATDFLGVVLRATDKQWERSLQRIGGRKS